VSVQRQRLTQWIIGTVVLCAVLGAWFGHHVGDGRGGYVALISATCGVIGSFLPGAVLWLRARLRDLGNPHRGAA
jgi:uncharacterized protein YcfJ